MVSAKPLYECELALTELAGGETPGLPFNLPTPGIGPPDAPLPPAHEHWRQVLAGEEPVFLIRPGFANRRALSDGAEAALLGGSKMKVCGFSGTSGGAVTGAFLADCLLRAEVAEAANRLAARLLKRFWHSDIAVHDLFYGAMDLATRIMNATGPASQNTNPLLNLLKRRINFNRINNQEHIAAFIATTRCADKNAFVFSQPNLSAEVVAASAALPGLFSPIRFHNPLNRQTEEHEDGGFNYNAPVLRPLAAGYRTFLLVRAIPYHLPPARSEKGAHYLELAKKFDAPLNRELKALKHVNKSGELGRKARVFIIDPPSPPNFRLSMVTDVRSSLIESLWSTGEAHGKQFLKQLPTYVD